MNDKYEAAELFEHAHPEAGRDHARQRRQQLLGALDRQHAARDW